MRRVVMALALALAPAPVGAADDDMARAAALLAELTDPALEGRGAESAGLVRAREIVVRELESAGISPGATGGEWLQAVPDAPSLHNVIGVLPGSGPEWIIVGAHYDGLGVGAPGTDQAGEVFTGADDNASGVVALAQVARTLAGRADSLERSIYLVGFTAEETELRGSRAFVAAPPAPLENCVAMINLDTIGRLEEDRLLVFGAGTAAEWKDLLNGVNYAFGFDLALNDGSGSASDHASFVAKGVPVLHFFTGAKAEYHRPGDAPDLVSLEGVVRVADFVAECADYLAGSDITLTFRPEGVDRLAAAPGSAPKRRVSFGSIPDFSRESGGILLSGVMPGGPAEAAGLLKGDLLVEVGGMTLDTIADFQASLAGHEPGDAVEVKYVREGEERTTRVTLAERKR